MALSELQNWILREVATKGGLIRSLPVRPGVTLGEMEQAVEVLAHRQYLAVIGESNLNSDIGMDVDEIRLLPRGAAHLRSGG